MFLGQLIDECTTIKTYKKDSAEYTTKFSLSNQVNNKPSWVSENGQNAIWYIKDLDEWGAGVIEVLGTSLVGLKTTGGQGSAYPFNVPASKWEEWSGSWQDVVVDEWSIKCIGE